MRYPDGGGLTADQRTRREEVRLRAADLFDEDVKVPCIARELRVSEKSVYQWRRAWEAGGREALCSKGPPGYDCRLGPRLQAELAAWLEEGPASHGWTDDQVWTAARVRTLIGRKFHISYSVSVSPGCCTGWASACRCPPGPPPNVTRTPSPHGGR